LISLRRAENRLRVRDSGRDGSFRRAGDILRFSSLMDPGRLRWAEGILKAGDGAGFSEAAGVSVTALEASEILLFDLP